MTTKKVLSTLLILTLCLGLIGCGSKSQDTGADKNTTTTTPVDDKDNTADNTDKTEDAGENTENTGDTNAAEDTGNADASTEDNETAEKIDIEIAALKGPTAIGMIQVMDDAANGTTANNYNFTLAGAADEISPKITSGEIQMAAVPCNLASVLYNKSQGAVRMAAINTLGVLYIVETGESIQSVEDLKGKTIYSTGKGTTPEYTLNQLLLSAGLDPAKDVTIEYKSEAAEVAAVLAETENAIAMLPQPFVTTAMMKNDKLRIALDVTAEWEARNEDSTVVTGVLLVNAAFAEEHPEAVASFLEEYKASADFVNENVTDAAALVEKFDIFKAAVAEKAIPYCNITLLTGEEMQQKASAYLNVLFEQNPKAVGGTLPDDAFYLIP